LELFVSMSIKFDIDKWVAGIFQLGAVIYGLGFTISHSFFSNFRLL